ncbi:MAG: pyrroline-5-carboxylate reductase [Clostridia bacterium]|nr:pyrroline-5-carboxylate reductase [Clostridia bacterium]MBQ8637401.1 pyrroline-5-carboxylate reductase [Clostridia bacterium]
MGKSIGFIGAGNMGGAIMGGISAKGLFDEVFVYDKNAEAANAAAEKYGVRSENIKTAANADIVILAVKPNVLYSVIDEIKTYTSDDAVIVSIAAGQSIDKIENAFGKPIKLMRVMPNTPALVGEGMSALSPNKLLSQDKISTAEVLDIFKSLGKAEIVAENLMDAVTGVSGSSPAYVFMFIEALADAAVAAGMPRDKSYTFAAQSVLGAAKMVLETGTHPAELKDMVCSPGGTTIEAVKVLEEKGLRAAVMDAVKACVEKSRSM